MENIIKRPVQKTQFHDVQSFGLPNINYSLLHDQQHRAHIMVSEHTSSLSWSHIIDGIWYTQWPINFGQYKKCWQKWF